MNPKLKAHIQALLAKQARGDKLTAAEQRDLTTTRMMYEDEVFALQEEAEKAVTEGSSKPEPQGSDNETRKTTEDSRVDERATIKGQQEAQNSPAAGGKKKPDSNAESTEPQANPKEPYQIGKSEFRQRTQAEVDARNKQGRDFLARGANARMRAAAETGRQVNELKASREAELRDAGTDPARARIVAQMEAQNMLRAAHGLPQYKESDIVGDAKGGYSLSPSSRDQRIFNEERGATEYSDAKGNVLGNSIRQPDGNIAFSTTKAGREFMGTEGRDRWAGIGRGFGGPNESPMDRALVERYSNNGAVDMEGLRSSTQGSSMPAAGQFAQQSVRMLGDQRRAEFSAAMQGRTGGDAQQDVGVDARGTPRTAKDLIERARAKGGVRMRMAGSNRTYSTL
jgi:hypothetical protein